MTAAEGAIGEGLRLAVQRSGRLTDASLALLRNAGFTFESYSDRLFARCRNFPLAILFGRDDDIPEYVTSGTVDLGIVGHNLIVEEGVEERVDELLPLGFGYCSLVLAVPKDSGVSSPGQLAGATVATSYPRSARRFFAAEAIAVDIVTLTGSVEVAPTLGLASAVVELTVSGSTLLLHDLQPIQTILTSEAVLVANRDARRDLAKRELLDRFLLRVKAVVDARNRKYLVLNAPRAALPAIQRVTPGLKSPTVVALADPDWVAVHTVITEDEFWEVIERLRAAGATEILVFPIEKLLL